MQTTVVNITIIVDESGCVVASHDYDAAVEAADNDGLEPHRRVINLELTVPIPECLQVKGEISGDNARMVLTPA